MAVGAATIEALKFGERDLSNAAKALTSTHIQQFIGPQGIVVLLCSHSPSPGIWGSAQARLRGAPGSMVLGVGDYALAEGLQDFG